MSRPATKVPRVPCRACNGRGDVALPLHLFRVLLEVRALGPATAADVIRELRVLEPVNPTAMNNRLAALERLGFIGHSREGKTKRYHLPRIVSRLRVGPNKGEAGGGAT